MKFRPVESRLRKQGFFYIAGIDEAGRGPLAGPVVSAAVILKKGARLPGLTDSKKLSAKKREELFEKILTQCISYSIAVISPQFIDEHNILYATQAANDLCLTELEVKPDFVLFDGRDKQITEFTGATIIKGDLHVKSIAAASILAKVTRDKIMCYYSDQFPDYGFSSHMGYGTVRHQQAIRSHGRTEIHRHTFLLKHEK